MFQNHQEDLQKKLNLLETLMQQDPPRGLELAQSYLDFAFASLTRANFVKYFQGIIMKLLQEAQQLSFKGCNSFAQQILNRSLKLCEPSKYFYHPRLRVQALRRLGWHLRQSKQTSKAAEVFQWLVGESKKLQSEEEEIEALRDYKQILLQTKKYKKVLLVIERSVHLLKLVLASSHSLAHAKALVDLYIQAATVHKLNLNFVQARLNLRYALNLTKKHFEGSEDAVRCLREAIQDCDNKKGDEKQPQVVINLISGWNGMRVNINKMGSKSWSKIKDVFKIYSKPSLGRRPHSAIKFRDQSEKAKALQQRVGSRIQTSKLYRRNLRKHNSQSFNQRNEGVFMQNSLAVRGPQRGAIEADEQPVFNVEGSYQLQKREEREKLNVFPQPHQNVQEIQDQAPVAFKAHSRTISSYIRGFLQQSRYKNLRERKIICRKESYRLNDHQVEISLIKNAEQKISSLRVADYCNSSLNFSIKKTLSAELEAQLMKVPLLRNALIIDLDKNSVQFRSQHFRKNIGKVVKIQRCVRSFLQRLKFKRHLVGKIKLLMAKSVQLESVPFLGSIIWYPKEHACRHFLESLVRSRASRIFYRKAQEKPNFNFVQELVFIKEQSSIIEMSFYLENIQKIKKIQGAVIKKKNKSLELKSFRLIRKEIQDSLFLSLMANKSQEHQLILEQLGVKGSKVLLKIDQYQFDRLKSCENMFELVEFDLREKTLHIKQQTSCFKIELQEVEFGLVNEYNYGLQLPFAKEQVSEKEEKQAALKIQKAYLKKKQRQSIKQKREQKKRLKEAQVLRKQQERAQQQQLQKKLELQQKQAALKIEKAYLKKKNHLKKQAKTQSAPPLLHQQSPQTKQADLAIQSVHSVIPDQSVLLVQLQPEVQTQQQKKAALKIEGAYIRRKQIKEQKAKLKERRLQKQKKREMQAELQKQQLEIQLNIQSKISTEKSNIGPDKSAQSPVDKEQKQAALKIQNAFLNKKQKLARRQKLTKEREQNLRKKEQSKGQERPINQSCPQTTQLWHDMDKNQFNEGQFNKEINDNSNTSTIRRIFEMTPFESISVEPQTIGREKTLITFTNGTQFLYLKAMSTDSSIILENLNLKKIENWIDRGEISIKGLSQRQLLQVRVWLAQIIGISVAFNDSVLTLRQNHNQLVETTVESLFDLY